MSPPTVRVVDPAAPLQSNPTLPIEQGDVFVPHFPDRITLNVDAQLKNILAEMLSLGDRAARFTDQTQLLGSLPELDSMAVVSVITTIEERFGVVVEDDEISAQTFATFGTLRDFVAQKLED